MACGCAPPWNSPLAAAVTWMPTMSWADRLAPARMRRIAVLAPDGMLPRVLALVAEAGTVELGSADGSQAGRFDELTPPARLDAYAGLAVRRSGAAALAGWTPAKELMVLAARLADAG